MESPRPLTKQNLLNFLNTELNKIPLLSSLQDWLDAASKINPAIAKALDGMYCGTEGRIHEQIEGLPHEIWLTMGWYKVTTVRVEYAYFS